MKAGEVATPGPGELVRCIQSGADGGPFIFELELAPGVTGPPVHSHDEGDETVLVLSGQMVFKVGGRARVLRAGESLTLTPNDKHTFWNASKTEPVRARVVHGHRFERAIAQPDFASLAIYLTRVDPGASRVANPVIRMILGLVAWCGVMRGKKTIEA